MENQYLKNINKGDKVEIISKQNKIVKGIIEEIITKDSYNLYGIMVRLENGDIGRVQKIILNNIQKNEKNINQIEKMIKNGEDIYTEFKLGCLWSQNYSEEDIKQSKSYEVHAFKQKASRVIIAKSIAAFLNSEGGNLVIGVKEKKEKESFEIIGIEEDFKKINNNSKDNYKRMILDDIIRAYFPNEIYNHLNDYIKIDFAEVQNKILCIINIMRSEKKVFLEVNGKKIFVIRVDSENRVLENEDLVDYCMKRFK
jgi:uncharacterized repeat protein (TIGR03833 family)